MKKRASAKNVAAKKPTRAPAKPAAARAARPVHGGASSPQRAQAEIEKAKYTPAPLKTDGWPAFRYPPA
jgi:hypothetical protein